MSKSDLRLFISYSHFDLELLSDKKTEAPTEFLRILRGLERENISVDFDRSFNKAGDVWSVKIEEKLASCDILIPILSDDFIQSKYCNNIEVKTILTRKRNGHDVLITPFYYKYCDWHAVPWIRERDIRPTAEMPLQAILDGHHRTKAMIGFRAEISAQASLLRGGRP